MAAADLRPTLEAALEATLEATLSAARRARPDASVYTGTGGLAHLFLHLHEQQPQRTVHGRRVLAWAVELADAALERVDARPASSKDRNGFLCTAVGVRAVAAAVYARANHAQLAETQAAWVCEQARGMNRDPTVPSEVLYGRAGVLYALLLLRKHLGADLAQRVGLEAELVRDVCHKILDVGEATAQQLGWTRDTPYAWLWHDKMYVGAAHGVAGIVMLLMCAGREAVGERWPRLERTLAWLFGLGDVLGRWPSSLHHDGRPGRMDLVQWCHGAPGLCALKAHAVYGRPAYLEVAQRCEQAIVAHAPHATKGLGLCHGLAGLLHVSLLLDRVLPERPHARTAYALAKPLMQWEQHLREGTWRYPDHLASVWEGVGGVAWAFADTLAATTPGFPCCSDV